MYRIYVWTVSGILLYVSEHATANLARFWMYAWHDRGFFPLANAGPEEFTISTSAADFAAAFFVQEAGPAPTPTVSRDQPGLDVA